MKKKSQFATNADQYLDSFILEMMQDRAIATMEGK